MRVDRIQVRVLIEGVLVPHISDVYTHSTDTEVSTASLGMAPIPGFETEELKRARVHIFWSDIDIRSRVAEDEWPLLFEGEITGDSFGKSEQDRHQGFTCTGYHTYWEQTLYYYFDPSSAEMPQAPWTKNLSLFLGNNEIKVNVPIAGADVAGQLVARFDEHRNEPYHNIVKSMFGDALDTNYFFSLSDEALKLVARMTGVTDNNVSRIIGITQLKLLLQHEVESVRGSASMMDVLKKVLALFRYSIVCNPQPQYIGAGAQKLASARATASDAEKRTADAVDRATQVLVGAGVSETVSHGFSSSITDKTTDEAISNIAAGLKITADAAYQQTKSLPLTIAAIELDAIKSTLTTLRDTLRAIVAGQAKSAELIKDVDGFEDVLAQYLLLPDMRFALPPACNVIFPQDHGSLAMDRNLLAEPTRAICMPQQLPNLPMSVFMVPGAALHDATVPTRTISPQSPEGYKLPIERPWGVTSGYGFRQIRDKVDTGRKDPATGEKIMKVLHPNGARFHDGLDIIDPRGGTEGRPIHAFDEGIVTVAGQQDPNNIKVGYGIRVFIDHGNGTQTRYGHMKSLATGIAAKKPVTAGQVIGYVGTTGQSTGPHLHFEIRVGGQTTDPRPILNKINAQGDDDTGITPVADSAGQSLQPQGTTVEVTPEESKFGDDATDGIVSPLLDYKYMTSEEQLTGIVPYFDSALSTAHALVDFAAGTSSNDYIRQLLESEWLWQRYSKRSIQQISMTWSPHIVAGMPALVVDKVRSIVGMVRAVDLAIQVGGGMGNASTSVALSEPRFWDEGDPYYWKGGASRFGKDSKGEDAPDQSVAKFPAYLTPQIIGTNSGDYTATGNGRSTLTRPVDAFYQALLGCPAIPYQYADRDTVFDTTVAYNTAIDTRREDVGEDPENKNTIVGTYYTKAGRQESEANQYAKDFTQRRVVNERQLMTEILGATADATHTVYTGGPFRGAVEGSTKKSYQGLVKRMNQILAATPAHRG